MESSCTKGVQNNSNDSIVIIIYNQSFIKVSVYPGVNTLAKEKLTAERKCQGLLFSTTPVDHGALSVTDADKLILD